MVGFAEGVGVAFVRIGTSLFMIELKSEQVRKVNKFQLFKTVLPFMSFYTPGTVTPHLSFAFYDMQIFGSMERNDTCCEEKKLNI